ncbi:MAG: peptidoglycan DD-metalloendopeptidase family protein [Alphaproteobacteria bacterium]|nr:peptidoglycan DD-metalloendopeptidase family protein [Alphaproteobacteria bacterium]
MASNAFDHAPHAQPGRGVLDMTGTWTLGTPGHRGWDWRLPVGTPLRAMADGVVVFAGVVRPFHCAVLGRTVDDQRTLVLQHREQDQVYNVIFDHLEQVDVTVGRPVRRGDVVARSGNSGCSTGPHLHLEVGREIGDRRVSVDPYGWLGRGPDPWADAPQGTASIWLWRDAPIPWREVERAPEEAEHDGPVFVRAVRYAGWDDARYPSNERVILEADPRVTDGTVDLGGWALVGGDEHPATLPEGTEVSVETPLEVYMGEQAAGPGSVALGRAAPMLPDPGGTVRLLDPSGGLVHLFRYGLAAQQGRRVPEAARACPGPAAGCVPLPIAGGVGPLAFSAEGRWLAVRVGTGIALLPSQGEERALIHDDLGVVDLENPGGLAWRGPEQLLLDLATSDGGRRVWSVLPGLQPAVAFPPRPDVQLGVADAVADAAVLRLLTPAGSTLGRWRPGQAEVEQVSRHQLPLASVALAPDGTRLAYLRGGAAWVIDLGTLEEAAWQRGLPGDAQLGWLGGDLVAQEHDRVVRLAPNGPPRPLQDGLGKGALGRSPGGRWVAVQREDGGLVVIGADGRRLEGPVVQGEVTALAVAHGAGAVELAWALPLERGAPPALFRARLATAPVSPAAPAGGAR